MSEQGLPQCKACYGFMPESFRDFDRCVRCFFEAMRAAARRPRLTQPSYVSPLERLEKREHAS